MNNYQSLARFYDLFTADIDYSEIAAAASAAFSVADMQVKTVLDVGCGTASLTFSLADMGYDMVGIDPSAEMLSIALQKRENQSGDVLLLNQSAVDLDLNDTVDACVLSLDVINHITQKDELETAFRKIHLFMNKGGVLFFDMNTPKKFGEMYSGNCYAWEQDDIYCVIQSEFDDETGLYAIDYTFFEQESDGSYNRYDDTVLERAYTADETETLLKQCGFTLVGIEETENGNRVRITAKKS